MVFKKPDGTTVTKDTLFYTDGSDGKVEYTTVANDLSDVGRWWLQGYFELPTGKWHTSWYSFQVRENL